MIQPLSGQEKNRGLFYMNVHGANTLSVIQGFALLPKLFQIENVIAEVCEFSYQMHAT